jgi:hypothetical protein
LVSNPAANKFIIEIDILISNQMFGFVLCNDIMFFSFTFKLALTPAFIVKELMFIVDS